MCGRYMFTSPVEAMRQLFEMKAFDNLAPRFNVAPGQAVAVVRAGEGHAGEDPTERMLTVMEWGLVPEWMKERPTSRPMINARAETVAEKPSFRGAFTYRRCLVPANGWYEWRGEGRGPKQPYWIGMPDAQLFAFAGIWERWTGPGAENWLETVAILTQPAAPTIEHLHHRMPVVLNPSDYSAWLDVESRPSSILHELNSHPAETWRYHPVSTRINAVRNDSEECAHPISDSEQVASLRQGSLF